MLRGSPGTDFAGYVDLDESANQELGYAFPAGLSFLYLLTPFNLPRWARYTDASAGTRTPRSPRGIPLVSTVAPQHWTGKPNATITFPAIFGFAAGSTNSGVCIAAVK